MATDLWKRIGKGDKVKIYSSELVEPMKLDDRMFTVGSIIRSCVELVGPNGKVHKVHKDRIAEICKEEEMKPKDTKETPPQPQPTTETPQPQAPQTPPVPVVFTDTPTSSVEAPKPEPVEEKPEKTKPKKAKPKGKKDPALKADLKGMVASGFEIWSKSSEFTDGKGQDIDIRVEAHYIISKDGKTGRVVNTYDGYFPAANPEGQKYPIADIDKKREQLKAKGYKRRK